MTLLTHSTRTSSRAVLPTLALLSVLALACSGVVSGQNRNPDPTPSKIAVQELNAALEVARKQLNRHQEKTAVLEAQNRALAESLAESNRMLETMRAEHEELLLRMASLGVDLLKPDPDSLKQRLLITVRERDLVEQEKEKLALQLLRLSEAVAHFARTAVSPDAAAREFIEQEIRAANKVLGPATAPAREATRTMGEGRIVSIDPEIGLVVLNIGKKSGVREGMPLRILREETVIGTAMVVDVRESITGAMLQKISAEGEDVKVGDRIQPEARQF